MLHTIINNVRGSNGFDLLLMTIDCTPRILVGLVKNERKKLNAKNEVLGLFEKVADAYEAAGTKELALA